jgi:hypothetical protein
MTTKRRPGAPGTRGTKGAGAAPAWTATVTSVPLWPTVTAATIDRPAVDETGDGWSLTIAGWVVGQAAPVKEIHVLWDGALVRRTPVQVARPGVAQRFDELAWANRPGFEVRVGLLGLPPTAQLEVVAVLSDGTPVHLASIVVRHSPLVTHYEPRLSPITVTSLGRMGTTWLMRLLAHHPEVVVHPQYPHELGMAKYWAHLLRVASSPADHLTSSHPETFTADAGHTGHNPYFGNFLNGSPELNRWLGGRQPALLGACAQQSLDEFYGEVATLAGITAPRFFAEKSLPDHVPDVLGDLYPAGRELILVRDIRDVICSAIAFDAKRGTRSFGRESLVDDLGFVSQLHKDLERLTCSWRRRKDTALLVRYETLIAAPERTVREILDHLGLDCTHDMVEAVLAQASATTPELDGHRTTTDPAASIGRWRTDLAPIHPELPERCEELFGPLLTELGYTVAVPRARQLRRDMVEVLGHLDGAAAAADA